MKKLFSIFALCLVSFFSFSQNVLKTNTDTVSFQHKNIITIDATYMLRQLFNFNQFSYYNNNYIIGYTRKCGRNAVRINLGGSLYNDNTVTNDSIAGKNSNNNFTGAVGYEHYFHLARRWSFYIGIDAVFNFRMRNYQSETSDGQYQYFEKSKSYGYGGAPFCGLIFRINQRLEIATETAYEVDYTTAIDRRYYVPSTQWDTRTVDKEIISNYFPPQSILLRIHF